MKQFLHFLRQFPHSNGKMLMGILSGLNAKLYVKMPLPYLDADSSQRGLCVVAAVNKFTQTTEVLWRKGDGMATL